MKLNEVKALGPVDFYTKLQTSSLKDKKVVINFRAVPFDKKSNSSSQINGIEIINES